MRHSLFDRALLVGEHYAIGWSRSTTRDSRVMAVDLLAGDG